MSHKHRGDKHIQGTAIDNTEHSASNKIFTDATWNGQGQSSMTTWGKAGIGIFMQVQEGKSRWQIKFSASTMQAQSAIHAEALVIKLAAIIFNKMRLQEATILTDNLTLAKAAAAAREPSIQPGHWIIRGLLTNFCALTNSSNVQVFHVSRNHNREAHDAARQAYSQESHPNQSTVTTCNIEDHQQWHHSLVQIIPEVIQQGYAIHPVNCCYFE